MLCSRCGQQEQQLEQPADVLCAGETINLGKEPMLSLLAVLTSCDCDAELLGVGGPGPQLTAATVGDIIRPPRPRPLPKLYSSFGDGFESETILYLHYASKGRDGAGLDRCRGIMANHGRIG